MPDPADGIRLDHGGVKDRQTRHGLRQAALLQQGDEPAMPEVVREDIHERLVEAVGGFR